MQFASLRRCSSRGAGTVFTSAMVFSSRDASRNAACGIDICEQNIGCDQVLAAETDVAIIRSNRNGRIVFRGLLESIAPDPGFLQRARISLPVSSVNLAQNSPSAAVTRFGPHKTHGQLLSFKGSLHFACQRLRRWARLRERGGEHASQNHASCIAAPPCGDHACKLGQLRWFLHGGEQGIFGREV